MKKKLYIVWMITIALLLVGCKKNESDVEASAGVDGPRTAAEVLTKSVEFYKANPLTSVVAEARGTLASKENGASSVDVAAAFTHMFTEDKIELNNSRLLIKTIYKNKPFKIDLHFFSDGSIGYGFSNTGTVLYDASDISGMIGIKKTIPPCTNIIPDETVDPFASAEPSASASATDGIDASATTDHYDIGSPSVSADPYATGDIQASATPTATVVPTTAPTISDLVKLSERLKLKGSQEFEGRDAYVLKGGYSNNEIVNDINAMLESNLYNLPNQYGNIYFDIYIDKETYEILGMNVDVSEIIKTVCKSTKDVENIIKVVFKVNTGAIVKDMGVKKAGLANFSNVWNVIEYYSNVMTGLVADATN